MNTSSPTTPSGSHAAVIDPFEAYRSVVADIFARHRNDPETDRCACGQAWPCRDEMLAAELLDWI